MQIKKGWWITIGVLVGIIGIFVILLFTLFSLKTVAVDFHTSTNLLTGSETAIVESGHFAYGKPVLFIGKKDPIAKMEKEFPYLRVIHIETVFPSKYIIHCAERQELYVLQLGENAYYIDEYFKVLRVENEVYQPAQDKPILVKGLEVGNPLAEPGEFLQINNAIDIYSAFVENNRLAFEQKTLISNMQYEIIHDSNINADQPAIRLKTYSGQTYLIKNATYGLKFKIAKMMAVYSQIYTLIGQVIDDAQPAEGGNIWTLDKINAATIEINNFYRTDLHGEEECYFKVIPPQNLANY